jgi:Flp pilus assembly protein TadD
LGKALLRQGRNREALTHFAEAVRLQPGFAEARNNLRALQASEEQAKTKP